MLKVRTMEEFLIQYGMTQNNLRTAYNTFGEVKNKADNCKKAIKAYEESPKIYIKKEFPVPHEIVKKHYDNALSF